MATRRIREVLPLTEEWYRRNAVDDLFGRFRRIGRSLGRVRDADVRIALLLHVEARIPSVAPSLVVVRQEHERERLIRMRKLIKRFERVEVERLLHDIAHAFAYRIRPWTSLAGQWRQQLRRMVVERAHAAHESVRHASGVYFPNRIHTTRVALKRFRYAAEIGEITGLDPGEGVIRDLKKSQDVLGDLHDRQQLIDELPTLATPEHPDIGQDHVRLAVQVLEAEKRELHAGYVGRRERLVEICEHAQRTFGDRRIPVGPAVALGAVAFSSALYAWRRRSVRDAPKAESVAMRIPIHITERPRR